MNLAPGYSSPNPTPNPWFLDDLPEGQRCLVPNEGRSLADQYGSYKDFLKVGAGLPQQGQRQSPKQ